MGCGELRPGWEGALHALPTDPTQSSQHPVTLNDCPCLAAEPEAQKG